MKARMLIGTALAIASGAGAQGVSTPRLEFRPFVAAYVPTGRLADELKTGTTAGAQVAMELSPRWHVVGTGAWTRGTSKIAALNDDATNIWQFDAGAEATGVEGPVGGWIARNFFSLGAGARTYDYRDVAATNSTCWTGYAGIGGEVQRGMFGVRCEARDYVSCYKSPATGERNTRNDLRFGAGFALHF